MGTQTFREPPASDPNAQFPPPPWRPQRDDEGRRIMVVLRDGLPIVDPGDPTALPDVSTWLQLESDYGVEARSPFESVLRLDDLKEIDETAHVPTGWSGRRRPLGSLLELRMPAGLAVGLDLLGLVRRVQALDIVDQAYIVSRMAPLPGTGNPSRVDEQFYLGPAPGGVNAEYGWDKTNCDGADVVIVDVERSWSSGHPDLPPFERIGGIEDPRWQDHGTAVLGVLAALDDGRGIRGLAPAATLKTVATEIGARAGIQRMETALLCARQNSRPGDVILIEEQTEGYLPVEIETANQAAIRAIADDGWIVVEAAANGGLSLDLETWNDEYVLAPLHDQFFDSGAIIVGAGLPASPPMAIIGSNYGTRVDCCAAGRDVVTTAPPDGYVTDFSGTSSAAAIVAGAAVMVQGYLRDVGPGPLNSRQMRWVLSNYTSGPAGGAHQIGTLPDVERIIEERAWTQIPNPLVYP